MASPCPTNSGSPAEEEGELRLPVLRSRCLAPAPARRVFQTLPLRLPSPELVFRRFGFGEAHNSRTPSSSRGHLGAEEGEEEEGESGNACPWQPLHSILRTRAGPCSAGKRFAGDRGAGAQNLARVCRLRHVSQGSTWNLLSASMRGEETPVPGSGQSAEQSDPVQAEAPCTLVQFL